MKKFLSPALLTLILFFTVLAADAQTSPRRTQPKPTPAPAKANSELVFPEIEGWENRGISRYPTAALGYSVFYRSENGTTADVYVYDGGHKVIPATLTGPVKQEFENAKADIHAVAQQTGMYQNLKEIKSETAGLTGAKSKIKTLHAVFSFSVKGTNVISDTYLFARRNKFIKIRMTKAAAGGNAQDAESLILRKKLESLFVIVA